jgi:hypothetical protein
MLDGREGALDALEDLLWPGGNPEGAEPGPEAEPLTD